VIPNAVGHALSVPARRTHELDRQTKHRLGEQQNHRIVGVGRDLCGSPSPTLLPKQGHLQQTVVF